MFKSKWSSWMIDLISEEHERSGPSAKLRLYFGGGGKRGSRDSKVPQRLTLMKSPSRTSYMMKSPASSTMTMSLCGYYGHENHSESSWELDMMIIGYGYGNGVRRGSSAPMISDVGSDDSALSSIRSWLRSLRKPIPVVMFLRGGV